MNVTNAGPVQKCNRCGQDWILAHYCPALHAPHHSGAKVVVAITEADVRRIVREELARDLAVRRERSRALMLPDIAAADRISDPPVT